MPIFCLKIGAPKQLRKKIKMKKIITFTFCMFMTFVFFAQAEYIAHPVTDNQSGSGSIDSYLADFDGDGDMDVVTAYKGNARIIWFENIDGHGQFAQKQVVTYTLSNIKSILSFDVDMDGDMDILAATGMQSPKIVWYDNLDGAGNFGAEKEIDSKSVGFSKILAGDLDGDDDIDIIALSTDASVYWYKNDAGAFSSPIFFRHNVSLMNLSDMDNDGDIDIILRISGKIRIYGNNNGIFTEKASFDTENSMKNIATGDFNGDGYLDILLSGHFHLFWYQNTDNGASFVLNQESFPKGSCLVGTSRLLAVGDVDGDGDVDVFTTSLGKKFWFENEDGQGTFKVRHSFFDAKTNPLSIIAVDMDVDGDIDLLETNGYDVRWYENDGQGNSIDIHVFSRAISYNSLFSGDINNDDQNDLISSSRTLGCEWFQRVNGTDNWDSKPICSRDVADHVVALGDVNNDGFLDVLASNDYDSKVVLLKNQNSTFDAGTILANVVFIQKAVFTDLDNDGNQDVVVLEKGRVFWMRNLDGQGTFSLPKHILTLDDPIFLSVADVDSDNDLDLVIFSKGNQLIEWIENLDGNGTFKNYGHFHKVLEDESAVNYLDALDFDKDGDMDIVGKLGNKTIWFENLDGNGNFGDKNEIYNTPGNHVRISDINQDGNYDLISYGYNYIEQIFGQSNGFGEPMPIGGSAARVDIADLDSDGDLDIGTLQPGLVNNILWYENLYTPLSNQESFSSPVSIFPVPFSDKLFIDAGKTIEQVSIFNELGQLVIEEQKAGSIDVTNLTTGLYFCKIIDDTGKSYVRKIVKQ